MFQAWARVGLRVTPGRARIGGKTWEVSGSREACGPRGWIRRAGTGWQRLD